MNSSYVMARSMSIVASGGDTVKLSSKHTKDTTAASASATMRSANKPNVIVHTDFVVMGFEIDGLGLLVLAPSGQDQKPRLGRSSKIIFSKRNS